MLVWIWLIVFGAAFATAALSAIAGFGGAVLLLPVFIKVFGVTDAVAILTVSQLASNAGRVWLNRGGIERHLVGVFAAGAVPAAALGAAVFASAPIPALVRLAGVFLIVTVFARRLYPRSVKLGDRGFVALGAASGLGSALLGSVGPLVAPFFLARGLTRGAYIGTEAAAAVVMHLTKLIVFGAAAVLTLRTGLIGLALAPASIAGAWAGKRVVDQLPVRVFVALVEAGLMVAGALLLIGG
jgi:uncharacterized membrane protein YfcA